MAGSAVGPLCDSERVPAETASPRLTSKFVEALQYVAEKHGTQTRKASDVPYLGHLLSVAGLVIEADGTETQAIAALLHDAAEDQGGEETLAEIREKFGATSPRSSTNAATHSRHRNRLGANARKATSATCRTRRTTPSSSRWPTNLTTPARSCATSARTETSCGSGSAFRTHNYISGTTGRCFRSTHSASTTGWSTSFAMWSTRWKTRSANPNFDDKPLRNTDGR